MSEDTKVCPFCAETIKAAAVVCRFCGRDLPEVQTVAPKPPVMKSADLPIVGKQGGKKKKLRNLLIVIVAIPLLCFCSFVIYAIATPPEYNASAAATARSENRPGFLALTPRATETLEPTKTSVPTNTPIPTNTPVPILAVEIANVGHYLGSDGSVVFFGEVVNTGDLTSSEPEVSIALYDKDGGVLVSDSALTYLPISISLWFNDVLYPGEKAPFVAHIDNPGAWVDYEMELSYEEARRSDYDEHYDDFEITNDTGRSIDDLLYNYRISGEIENIGDETTGPVRFSVTMYSEDGLVVGAENYMLEVDPFPPGKKSAFTIDDYVYGDAVSYSILTRAIKQD